MMINQILPYYSSEKMTVAIAKAIDRELQEARDYLTKVYPTYKKLKFDNPYRLPVDTAMASTIERKFGMVLPKTTLSDFLYAAMLVSNLCAVVPAENVVKEFIQKFVYNLAPKGDDWQIVINKEKRTIDITTGFEAESTTYAGTMNIFLNRIAPAGLVVSVHGPQETWGAYPLFSWDMTLDTYKTWVGMLTKAEE